MKLSPLKLAMIIFAYLAAGVVATVIVAWTFAILVARPDLAVSQPSQSPRLPHASVPASWKPIASGFAEKWGVSGEVVIWSVEGTPRGSRDMRKTTVDASGFPFLALSHREVMDTAATPAFRSASWPPLAVPKRLRDFSNSGYLNLPVTPIWPGLVSNSVLYSALMVVVLRFVRHGRRALRLRRGQCARCGYDITGLAMCPECGPVDSAP